MTEHHRTIMQLLENYLDMHPDLRFGQALFNLGINQIDVHCVDAPGYMFMRDIYEDSDEIILDRMLKVLNN